MKLNRLHESKTVKVPLECMYCNKIVGYKEMQEHIAKDYPSTSTICPECLKTARSEIKHKSLLDKLNKLRSEFAAAAQAIYDSWEDDDSGGICDEIANEISSIIATNIVNVDIEDYGHDGDDHAAVVVSRGEEAYVVDIPASSYEKGGGYSWKKLPDVTFTENDVSIFPV